MDRREVTVDQAPSVERNFARNFEPRVLVHLCVNGIEGRLVGPYLTGKDNLLSVLRLHGASKIRLRAVGNIVLSGLDDLDAAIFLEDFRPERIPFAIALHLFLGHGNHKSRDVHALRSCQ